MRRLRPPAAWLRSCGLMLAGLLLTGTSVAACAPRALVALPSTSSRWVDAFTARASTASGVTVEARTDGWPGPSLDLGDRGTPILIRIENGGTVPLRVARDTFELVTGTTRFRALPPDKVGSPQSDLRGRELRPGPLNPGESEAGFVYFESTQGDWGFLHLRASLVDERSDALLGTLDVPFSSGYHVSCTLDRVAREEVSPDRDILFRACLPPP